MFDISATLQSNVSADLTVLFPDVLESLQGTDVNFEMVTSSTLRPLKLFYSHNAVGTMRGLVFVQTHLRGKVYDNPKPAFHYFTDSNNNHFTATEFGQNVVEMLKDPELLNIVDTELLIDLTKP